MVATSFIHGAHPFLFFPKCVYDYIAHNCMADATSGDVANPEVLEMITR